MTLSKTPRILITRLSAIGDCVLTLPMACAIKDQYPLSTITWVVERGAAALLRGHSCIDHLIELPKGWWKSPAKVWRLRRELRARPYDVALDPQSLSKSAAIAWMSGAPRRIGLAKPHGRELSLWLNNVQFQPTTEHVVDRQLEMLSTIGVKWPEARFGLHVPEASVARVDEWASDSRLSNGYVVMNPGATWDSRLWPTERYGAVARQLGERFGLTSLVSWCGERERGWAQEIVQNSDGHALIAPPSSLTELAELLRRAQLYIGSDTGPMHIAVAMGTRCVAMFGTTRPEASGPYGAGHFALQSYYQTGTSRQRRRANNDAMRAITTDMVTQACEQALSASSTRNVA